MSVLVTALFTWMAFCFYMLFRNSAVYRYRRAILDDIHDACQYDITQSRDYQWRYKVWESVSYDSMVIKFWRPLDSFYPNRTALTNFHTTKEDYHE